MGCWLIQLQGEKTDLEEFPRWFPDGEIFAREENGCYFLVGDAFKESSQAEFILQQSTTAFHEFSAIISLLWPAFRMPSIGPIIFEDDTGTRKSYVFMTATLRGRSKVFGVSLDVGNSPAKPAPTQAQNFLASAKGKRHLQLALAVWSDPDRTWARLYRVLEEIEKELGMKVHKAGYCSAAERSRFTRTANTAESSGVDSRHAAGQFQAPDNPMSFQQAVAFVAVLLQKALTTG